MILCHQSENRNYWWWLLLALLLHALCFAIVNRSHLEVENATLQVSSGDNAEELELVQAPEPTPPIPMETPSRLPDSSVPRPIEPVTTQPDDFAFPKPVSTAPPTPVPSATPPLPASSTNSQVASSHPVRDPHPSTSSTSSKQHHDTPLGERMGSAGNGKASYLYNPEPPYPEEARDALVQGTVELMVSVDETGKVMAVHLFKSSGDPPLDQSALQTVKTEWRFHPATVGGIAIASQILVPIHFKLKE